MPFVPDNQQTTGFIPDEQPAIGGFIPDVIQESEKRGFIGGLAERPEEKLPLLGGVIGAARLAARHDAFKRLEEGYDYSKPIFPERMGFGAMGHIPATYKTKEKDLQTLTDWINEANQQYTAGGRISRWSYITINNWYAPSDS